MSLDPGLYYFINQGCLTVDHMDDKEEMQIVEVRLLCIILPQIYDDYNDDNDDDTNTKL